MKLYLSSYKVGNQIEALKPYQNKKIAYIPNSLDFTYADPTLREQHIQEDRDDLRKYLIETDIVDLKEYFGKKKELKKVLDGYDGIWVTGGIVFVLRQAMKLSGLDELLVENNFPADYLYGGYSAGCCVLSNDLTPLKLVDDPADFPYSEIHEPLWNGVGLLNFTYVPHYKSDHRESANIDKVVQYCKEKEIPFKAFSDGEVLLLTY